jgi:hypothetical protein
MTLQQQMMHYSQEDLASRVAALERNRGAAMGGGCVWWNPSTQNFHDDQTGSLTPNYDGPVIANSKRLFENRSRLKGASVLSSTEQDILSYAHISQEYQPRFTDLFSMWDKLREVGKTKSAGVITMQSHPELANQIVSQEMLDLVVRDFSLEGNATVQRTAQTIEVALPTRITGTLWSTGLEPHDITDTVNITYATATTTLEKAQVHVANSIWVNLVERRRDVVADTLNAARKEEPRVMEDAIAAKLPQFADQAVTGGAFDLIVAGAFHHTHDPTITFFGVQNTVQAAGGQTNILVMSPYTALRTFNNTWLRAGGPLQRVEPVVSGESTLGQVFTHPMLVGYKIVTSRKIADGKIFQFALPTFWSITGPQRTGGYEKNPGYLQGTIIDKFYGAAIIEATLGKELTGATT